MLRATLVALWLALADGFICGVPAGGVATGRARPPLSVRATPAYMKIWDWKSRGDPPPDLETIDLSNLKVAPGSKQRGKRKGRGIAAGQGASCGFGMRGQKSRSGRSVRPGFEGGQIPLYRRLPKFVGRPMGPGHTKVEYDLIKLSHLNEMPEGSEVRSLTAPSNLSPARSIT